MAIAMDDPAPIDPRLDSLAYSLARYDAIGTPRRAFRGSNPGEAAAWRAEARASLRERVGVGWPDRADCPPLGPEFGEATERDGLVRRPITFATRPGMAACGYVATRADAPKGRRPAVVCLPGHGYGADDLVGLDDEGQERDGPDGYQHDFALQCARRGYVAVALEMIGFGKRRDPAAREKGPSASSCQPASGAALLLGESMVGWRVWDVIRTLDLLEATPGVDPRRLALMGISGGGTVALYAAALDERVAAAVLSCSYCTLRDSIYSIGHCIDNYVPGLLRDFEAADLAALIAPRGLIVEAGATDNIFPEPGVRAAYAAAERAFAASGAADRLAIDVFDGGHQFDGKAAFATLDAWLRPGEPS